MEKKLKRMFTEYAEENGLCFDEEIEVVYGNKTGYNVWISRTGGARIFELAASVTRGGAPMTKDEMKLITSKGKPLSGGIVQGNKIAFTFMGPITTSKTPELFSQAITQLTEELRGQGFENACQICDATEELSPCSIGGVGMSLCPNCFQLCCEKHDQQGAQEKQKKENLVGGVVGALLGSLIGAVCIVLLGQLGFIASLSGVVMGVCALKGYELFGGKLSRNGVIICAVIMLVMVYLANRMDWAITVAQSFEMSLRDSFRAIPILITEEIIEIGNYLLNLFTVYAFTLVGAIPTVRTALRRNSRSLAPRKI